MTKAEIYSNKRLTESYWPADTSAPLRWWTVPDALREAAAEVPDRLALVEGIADITKRRRWTYAQLLADAEKVASALLDRFTPGERVAVWADNIVEYVLLEYGCFIAGIILTTVNPAYKKREYLYAMKQSGAAGIFTIDEYRGYDLLATVNDTRDALPELREVIRFADFTEFMNSATGTAILPEIKPMDPLILIYTSGTTGFPKGATLHHYGRLNSDFMATERAGLEMGAVWINPMPMFHNASSGVCFTGILTHKGTHVLAKGFEPKLLLELIESERGTFTLMVPTMIEEVLAYPDREKYDLSSLKHIASGSALVEAQLVKRTHDILGCTISIVYGLTEQHAPISVTHREDKVKDQSETVGQPLPHCEVKVADPQTGKVLPVGVQGEICSRSYQSMLGYWDNPEATAKMIKPDGWMHTGDLGIMDKRGFIKITGRVSDMIIRGGEKVYPREVEILLLEHPKVEEVAVFGISDKHWGEQVMAVVKPRSFVNPPSAAELDRYCRLNLTHFKRPRFWSFVSDLPKTPTGKIQKYRLQDIVQKGELQYEKT